MLSRSYRDIREMERWKDFCNSLLPKSESRLPLLVQMRSTKEIHRLLRQTSSRFREVFASIVFKMREPIVRARYDFSLMKYYNHFQ